MKKKKGLFVSIEGGEGTGKTTQTKLLTKYLAKKGYKVELTQEPGGTRTGKLIRKILLDPNHNEIDKLTELFLYLADRAQHVKEVIIPALGKGKAVICDRFIDATVAYQGFGRGIPIKLIDNLNRLVTQGVKPYLTICLDLGPREGLSRAKSKYAKSTGKNLKAGDRLERESVSFHKKVRIGYLALARREPRRVKIIKVVPPASKTYSLIKKFVDKIL